MPTPPPPIPPPAKPTRRTGLAWQELNSLPATPPPITDAKVVSPPIPVPPAAPSPIGPSPSPKPSRAQMLMSGRGFVAAGAIAVAVVAGLFVFFPRGKGKRALPPLSPVVSGSPAAAPTGAEETPPARATETPEAAVEAPRPAPPPMGKRHIEITVQPAEAALLLDNRLAGGNAIKMDVAKAKTAHVVQARAPGYAPFRKTITYANDIYLEIKLEKVEAPTVQARTKTHPSQVAAQKETKPEVREVKTENKPAPAAAAPVEDFGMTLQRPATRRPTKRIDETDPYAP